MVLIEEAESVAVEDTGEMLTDGALVVEFFQHDDSPLIEVALSGQFSANIREVIKDGRAVYVSTEFGGEQPSLKKALDALTRNTASRAVSAAWDAAHPKVEKAKAERKRRVNPDIAALLERDAQREAELVELRRQDADEKARIEKQHEELMAEIRALREG